MPHVVPLFLPPIRRRSLLIACAGSILGGAVAAQPAVGSIVIGFPPGGAADALAQSLREQWTAWDGTFQPIPVDANASLAFDERDLPRATF